MKLTLLILAILLPACATNDHGRTRADWWLRTHSHLPPFHLLP